MTQEGYSAQHQAAADQDTDNSMSAENVALLQTFNRMTPIPNRRQPRSIAPAPPMQHTGMMTQTTPIAAPTFATPLDASPTPRRKAAPAKPAPRLLFLQKFPDHIYVMPQGPQELNFTGVEILTLLPNWVKNEDIANRLLSNGLEANIHVAILQQHHGVNIPSNELSRVKDGIGAMYRKTMRKSNSKWTKAGHRTPANWDANDISVSQFVPDEIQLKGAAAAQEASIPFSDLMKGVQNLPQGVNAGDLTHALEYALSNAKPSPYYGAQDDWIFPDDIHTILQQAGYITVTADYADGQAFRRYDTEMKNAAIAERKRRYDVDNSNFTAAAPLAKRQKMGPAQMQTPQPHVPAASFMPLPSMEELRKSPYWQQPKAPMTIVSPYVTRPADNIPAIVVHPPQGDDVGHPQHGFVHPQQQDVTETGMSAFWYHQQLQTAAAQMTELTPHQAYHHHGFQSQPMAYTGTPTPSQPQPQSVQEHATAPSAAAPTANMIPTHEHVLDISGEHETMTYLTPDAQALQVPTVDPEPIHDPMAMPPAVADAIDHPANEAQPTGIAAEEIFDFDAFETMMAQHAAFEWVDAAATAAFGRYSPTDLLAQCTEGDDAENESDLARGSRYCRDEKHCAKGYKVGDLEFVVALIIMSEDAAEFERRG